MGSLEENSLNFLFLFLQDILIMRQTLFLLFFILISSNIIAQKNVAFTVDYLPFVMELSIEDSEKSTNQLLKSFEKHKVEAVGFVNERFILNFGTVDERINLLDTWLKNGHELGNHTFSHPSFNETSLEEYSINVLKGEAISKKLSKAYGKPYRYFRHPFLHTGQDSLKRTGFDQFLKKNGYTVAPVTVDSYDWYFNKVYVDALKAGDTQLATEIGEAYVKHTEACFEYYEKLAVEVVGRSISQIFLCHANKLNATYLDKVMENLKGNGYTFVPVQEALKDNVYLKPVSIEANRGSWLHRWRLTAGIKTTLKAPELPEKIVKLFEGK